MFGFGKKKQQKSQAAHNTNRSDWDMVLDELFLEIVHQWANGLAVISQSGQAVSTSGFGGLKFRIKDRLDTRVKVAIKDLRRNEFDRIFNLVESETQSSMEFHAVKNLGLPNNSLVYTIYGANDERALVVFGGTYRRSDLNKYQRKIETILARAPRGAVAEVMQAKEPTNKKAPPPLSVKLLPKAKEEHIKARLVWLEDQESLNSMQEAEKRLLQDYVVQNLKSKML